MKPCISYQSILKGWENKTQYTNHQMNNAAKKQIYPKKSQYISLEWMFDMIVRNDSLTFTKTVIATIIRYEQ